jgi:hypothetical protein
VSGSPDPLDGLVVGFGRQEHLEHPDCFAALSYGRQHLPSVCRLTRHRTLLSQDLADQALGQRHGLCRFTPGPARVRP